MHADSNNSTACKPRPSWRMAKQLRKALDFPARARGGQPGNANRMTHGRYGKAFQTRRAQTRQLLGETRDLLALVEANAHALHGVNGRAAPAFALPHLPLY